MELEQTEEVWHKRVIYLLLLTHEYGHRLAPPLQAQSLKA